MPLAFMLPALLAALEVGGTAVCPAPAAVQERLGKLLPQGAEQLQHRAEIEQEQGWVRVLFLAPDGARLAQRELRAEDSCEVMADAVAVVVAAWEAELLENAPPEKEPRRLAVEVGLLGSLASGQAAPGAVLGIAFGPRGSRWGARVSLEATTLRRLGLGEGGVQWLRALVRADGRWCLLNQGVRLELVAQLVGALTYLRGVGFTENSAAVDFDPGLGAAFRSHWPLNTWSVWAEVGATGWLRTQHGVVDGVGAVALPRIEMTLRIGVAFGRE